MQTVYDFYTVAINNERRKTHGLGQLLRLAAVSSRDLTKEGNKSINQAWTDVLKSFEKGSIRKSTVSSASAKPTEKTPPQVVAHNQTPAAQQAASAAATFLSAGDFSPVRTNK